MKSKLFYSIAIALTIGSLTSCSLVKPRSGDENLSFLKGQNEINVVFDYSAVAVGKYSDEEDYLEEGVKERNEKKSGSGDEWRKAWYEQRDKEFEPRFIEIINRYNNKGLKFTENNENTEYTLLVIVNFMEPGFNVGMVRKDAEMDFTMKYVPTENMDKSEASFDVNDVPGATPKVGAPGMMGGFDFTAAQRLVEAYAKGAKEMALYIKKQDI